MWYIWMHLRLMKGKGECSNFQPVEQRTECRQVAPALAPPRSSLGRSSTLSACTALSYSKEDHICRTSFLESEQVINEKCHLGEENPINVSTQLKLHKCFLSWCWKQKQPIWKLQNQRLELSEAATEEISHVWKGTLCSSALGLLIYDNSFRHLLSENHSRCGH